MPRSLSTSTAARKQMLDRPLPSGRACRRSDEICPTRYQLWPGASILDMDDLPHP